MDSNLEKKLAKGVRFILAPFVVEVISMIYIKKVSLFILIGLITFWTGCSANKSEIPQKEKNFIPISKVETDTITAVSYTHLFLKEADNTIYYYLFIVALETGMRLGELAGLQWKDIDFKKKVIHVRHSLTYFSKNGKYVFQMHPTKTNKGLRDIPLTCLLYTSITGVFFLFVCKNIRTLFHLSFKYIIKFFLCHVINPPSVIRDSMK